MPPHDGSFQSFFSPTERARLEVARRAVDAETATIAYCLFESPFARSGGLFAVADNYTAELCRHARNVVVLAPYHSELHTAPNAAQVEPVGKCTVPFDGQPVAVDLMEHRRHGVRWVLFRSERFFDAAGGPGGTDPYSYADPTKLLNDSLFASAIVPHALAALGLRQNCIVHLQDWELAATALCVKAALIGGMLESAAVVLTAHNPYDHALPTEALEQLETGHKGDPEAETVFQQMLPLIDGPLTTVSESFARELITDPLQTEHFAPHLQQLFGRQGVVGIDNGVFGALRSAYSERAIVEARAARPARILDEKHAHRAQMVEALSRVRDQRTLGSLDEFSDDTPVFLMFGRLDPGQKGFDLFSRAIESLPRGIARFIMTPIVGGAPKVFLDDLSTLASNRTGEVVVYPFRWQSGYQALQAGASYVVMPSLYEPFGGATEAYLSGTPVVCRATGGLLQQVVDADEEPEEGTGLLFRESVAADGPAWTAIQSAATPKERVVSQSYGSMVAACAESLRRAIEIYRDQPIVYARMLANLYNQTAHFSWDQTIRRYEDVYRGATS